MGFNVTQALGESVTPWEILMDYDGGTNAIYIGKAPAGTATSVSRWQIRKVTWDANDNPTEVKWADDSPLFKFEWDERATYF